MRRLMTIVKIILLMSAMIAGSVLAQPAHMENQKFPDVVSVDVRARGEDRFDFDVTISSPYDTPRRYADAFRIMSQDAVIYGVHDHADEQPFTRDLYGVHVSAGVKELVIQARDTKYGYGGKTVTVILPGR